MDENKYIVTGQVKTWNSHSCEMLLGWKRRN